MARLLYIALWCEADREGRLQWKPRTFKMRYFPADEIDIESLCSELVGSALVRLYADGLAYIPTFSAHQHVNPRESASTLPDPETVTRGPRVSTRKSTVSDAQVGREGREGKESKEQAQQRSRGSRLPSDWSLTEEYITAAQSVRDDWSEDHISRVADQFMDYWTAQPGAKGVKLDWLATWRNWCRNDRSKPSAGPNGTDPSRANNWLCPEGTHPMELPKGDYRRDAYESRKVVV